MRLLLWIAVTVLTLQAAVPGDLDQLLETVKASAQKSREMEQRREAEFLKAAEHQEALLAETKKALADANKKTEQLKRVIDANEKVLGELEEKLRIRSANLGEMFGVVRQASGDHIAMARTSLVSAQFPEADTVFFKLAEAKELPAADDLRALWVSLQLHMVESGKVARFDADIIYPDGTSQKESVTRIGEFTAVSGENFLEYSHDSKAFIMLPRQPESRYTAMAGDFTESSDAYDVMTIDPTRGAMLGIMMERPTLGERIAQGGIVGYIIILLGLGGIAFALFRLYRLHTTQQLINQQLGAVQKPDTANPLGRVLAAYYDNRDLSTEDIEIKLDEAILKETPALTQGHVLVKLFAAVAPLLGLLGTVTGMIATFQAITLFGTGDAKLMAGGISQALVTTVLGLVTAMPLLFLHTLLNSKSRAMIQVLSEQAAGLMAHSLEKGR